MEFVVAIDSFKGSASSHDLNQAVKSGIEQVLPEAKVHTFAIADGGEGTISAVEAGIGGVQIKVSTVDLLGRPIVAEYLMAGDLAVIEAAKVVGIDKITPSEQTIQEASTFGLAQLFLDAKARGAHEILLSLGGTGTSDGGLGLLEGLGGSFEQLPDFSGVKITGLADVTAVYAGENGYAKVFGQQKGGTPELLEQQDQKAQQVVQLIKKNQNIDLQKIAGTGAAGGLGGAIVLLGGQLVPGFEKIAALLEIEEVIKKADLVITGEGRMDFQTAQGKVPFGMAKLAAKYQVPTVAFVGSLGDNLGEMEELLLAAYSIQKGPGSLEKAMQKERTLENLEFLTKNVIKTRYYGEQGRATRENLAQNK